MDLPVATAGLALSDGLPPVEHERDVQLAFASWLVVGGGDQVGQIVTMTCERVAEDVPGERHGVGTFYHVGVAILAVPKFTVVDPDVLGAALDAEVVPGLILIGSGAANHEVAQDDIARSVDVNRRLELGTRTQTDDRLIRLDLQPITGGARPSCAQGAVDVDHARLAIGSVLRQIGEVVHDDRSHAAPPGHAHSAASPSGARGPTDGLTLVLAGAPGHASDSRHASDS